VVRAASVALAWTAAVVPRPPARGGSGGRRGRALAYVPPPSRYQAALLLIAPGFVLAGNEIADDLVVVVNPAVPISRLSATDLESIFTATRRT
jgi:hypothetical protein